MKARGPARASWSSSQSTSGTRTRFAYAKAVGHFLAWCDERRQGLGDIEPMVVAAYVEQLTRERAPQTVKQHLAAIRMLFDWLVIGQVISSNPASSVRGPRYSRAPRGERVTGSVPRNYGAHTSVISTLGLSGPEAVWAVEGAVDTDVLNVYVERVLRPTIRRGDIPVLDNLRAHHASRIEEAAEECGAQVIWLYPTRPTSRRWS